MAEIKCPACGSEIGADGKSLIKRSARLEELEGAADVFEKRLAEIERERKPEKKSHGVRLGKKKQGERKQLGGEPAVERPAKDWWEES